MRVTINGESREIEASITVQGLVASLGLEGPVAVEINRDVVPRAQHASREVCEGDAIEIVHLVGGG
ncbi:MAG: sulfur carrier protein ThiS [Myxococcales bacterium]|nr:sulfur carrier protein ThiS [Myxococcales bacterium]